MKQRERLRRLSPCRKNIAERIRHDGFLYPFGSYPEKKFSQRTGYDSKFIKEGKYFYYQVVLSHERILPVLLQLLKAIPEDAFIVTQIHTDDYYKESDTYVSDEPVEVEELLRWIEGWKDVAVDDGFFGIGAFTEGPTMEVFLDEHKTIHVYHHDPDFMEETLERLGIAFVMDLKLYWDEPHYHESLPLLTEHSEDYLTAFEDLADKYDLLLDEDEDDNTDEDGDPLGMTCWKIELRGYKPKSEFDSTPQGFYSTLYLNAESRSEAMDMVEMYMESKDEYADLFLQMARVPQELLSTGLRRKNHDTEEPVVWFESERVKFEWNQPDELDFRPS